MTGVKAVDGRHWPHGCFKCPLTQCYHSDKLALAEFPVNCIPWQRREHGLMTCQDGYVTFHDRRGLVDLAEVDPAYLDQTGPLLK